MAELKSEGSLKRNLQCSIEVPAAVGQVAPELLAEALPTFTVVDVRTPEEFALGSIKGSLNISIEEWTVSTEAAVAKVLAPGKETIVFVSLQSPDLDQAAALTFTQKVSDELPKQPQVQILLGGAMYWFQLHGKNEGLTENFNAAHWEPLLRPKNVS